jgi:hypothetical protein
VGKKHSSHKPTLHYKKVLKQILLQIHNNRIKVHIRFETDIVNIILTMLNLIRRKVNPLITNNDLTKLNYS